MAMQARNQAAVVAYAVVRLVRGLKTLLRDRLETQEERFTPAASSQLHELFVARGIRRALACPPFSQRGESPEEFLCVTRIRADVIVPKHYRACRTRRDFTDDLINRTIPDRPRTVEERNGAVIAPMRAPARCNGDGLPVAAAADQIPTWRGHAGE